MGQTKAQRDRDIRGEGRERIEFANNDRNLKTKNITASWKIGFRALKEENDRLQKERDEAFNREVAEVREWMRTMIAQGPPR